MPARCRRARSLLLAVGLVALAATACSTTGGQDATPTTGSRQTTTTEAGPTTTSRSRETTTTTEPDVATTMPEVGDCWPAITGDDLEAISFPGNSVSCSEGHGGFTVGVVQATAAQARDITPDLLDRDPTDPDVQSVLQAVGSDACRRPWASEQGRLGLELVDPQLAVAVRATKLGRSFWFPTSAEWDAGARWVRCDLQTSDGTLFATPNFRALANQPVPADLVACFSQSTGVGTPIDCRETAAAWQVISRFQLRPAAVAKDQAGYQALLTQTLPPVCAKLTEAAVGEVGSRAYRIFAPPQLTSSDGTFTCAVKVRGPVKRPLGT